MNQQEIECAQRMYLDHTTREIAQEFGLKPCTMRKVFSMHGIKDPKAKRREKDRALAVKYRTRFGWTVAEIAEQLVRPESFVKRALRRLTRYTQLELWPPHLFRVAPRARMAVVRVSRKVNKYIQLSLDLFGDQMNAT